MTDLVRKGEFILEPQEDEALRNAIRILGVQKDEEFETARNMILRAEALIRMSKIHIRRAESYQVEADDIRKLLYPKLRLRDRIAKWWRERKPAGGLGENIEDYEDMKAYVARDTELTQELFVPESDTGEITFVESTPKQRAYYSGH